ncbi:MAG: DNA-processing protein DprA [Treponema sp.]|jgi:DNA processing protein|nr:DNA-processing protein DprA [Treponema sp.]
MADCAVLDLLILRIPGLKPAEQVELCGRFNGEDDAAGISRGDLEAVLGRPLEGVASLDELRLSVEREAGSARARGIRWVSIVSAAYPPPLREIADPPALLFYRGTLPDGERPMVAVVGTRRPHGAALRGAFEIGRDLGGQGISVVSGLALGIDAASHRGNLEGGGKTYAVLGSGVDEIYPSSNRPLARRILQAGGGILSEYPPGTGPRKWYYPARNRIISALARGTLIVEAPAKSGALITARFAREQGRDLWAAAAGMNAEGTALLAEEGAGIIHSASDILREWGLERRAEGCGKVEGRAIGKDLADSLARQLTIS